MPRALMLLLLAGCGRLGFGNASGTNDSGAPPDELGLSQDAVILGDGIAAAACGTQPLINDGFDDGTPAPFTTYTNSGLTLREMNSRFEIAYAANVSDGRYAGYKSIAYPSEGLCGVVRVITTPTSNGIQYFKLLGGMEQVEFALYQGFVGVRTHLDKQVATLLSLPFDNAQHAYWRIRQESGTTYWDVSADGVAYTVLASTMFLTEPMVSYELGAGSFGSSSNAGIAAFDDARLSTSQ